MEIEQIKKEIFKQNELNKLGNITRKKAIDILKEFKNKQILKKDNTLLKAVKEKLTHLEVYDKKVKHYDINGKWATLQIYINCSYGYNLVANLKYCYSVKSGGCEYFEQSVYIAKVENLILKEFYNKADDERKQINETEQLNQFKKVQRIINTLIDEKEKLNYALKRFLSESIKDDDKNLYYPIYLN
tara:strand:- start:396 stop:956 length:561 start_codon:yes stop_codon:yes gene_type:complete